MKKILYLCFFAHIYFIAYTQQVKDTLLLDEVYISKNLTQFSSGHELIDLSSSLKKHKNQLFLSSILQTELGIPIKTYGNGMLCTISVKGLSASHTGTYWEDLPLNSSMNGVLDFNLFQNTNQNQVIFRSGGGSAHFGSGSIGGSLHFSNVPKFSNIEKFGLETSTNFGSFDKFYNKISTFQQTTQATYSNSKFSISSSYLLLNSLNDYNYKINKTTFKLENSKIISEQFTTNIAYKFKNLSVLKFSFWNTSSNREIPTSIISSKSFAFQEDKTNRISLSYLFSINNIEQKLNLGFTDEFFNFLQDKRNGISTISKAENYFLNYSVSKELNNFFKLQIFNVTQHTKANSINFGTPRFTQNTTNLAIKFQPISKFSSGLTINKTFNSFYEIPFTYDFGMDYKLNSSHSFHFNSSSNYRVPTINDLFWKPGGNPNLIPESGKMNEFSYQFFKEFKNFKIDFSNKLHYGKIKSLISWNPDEIGFWFPSNINKVETKGVENHLKLEYFYKDFLISSTSNYSYISSRNLESKNQLAYVPLHTFNHQFFIQYKRFSILQTSQFNGKRLSSSVQQLLNSFLLHNILFDYQFNIHSIKSSISFGINNIFSKNYALIENYPLPLRNYTININIRL